MNNQTSKHFTANASWIMIGKVFQIVLTFITTLLVSRYLGPNQYGKITYAYSYVALFIPLANLGLNDIIVKQLMDNENHKQEVVGTAVFLRLIASLISIIIITFLCKIISNDSLFFQLCLIQSFSLLFQIYECLMYFYQADLLAKKSGMAFAIAYSVTAIFRVICLIMGKDLRYFALAVSLDYFVLAVILFFFYFKDGNKLIFNKEFAAILLKSSSNYLIAGILNVIANKADSILLGKIIDETNVGYYSACTTLCNSWPFILTAIIDSASPLIIGEYDNDKKIYQRRIKQLYAAIFYIGVTVALIFTLFSKLIINIVYGQAYLPASIPLKIASWSSIFSYFGVARFIWMQCEKKTRHEKYITLFAALCNLLLNYLLISAFGIKGAATSLLLTQFLANFVLLFFIKDTKEDAKLILEAILLKDVFNKED